MIKPRIRNYAMVGDFSSIQKYMKPEKIDFSLHSNEPKEYDFLIVGSGLFGAVFARQVTDAGYTCLVVEKRQHQGGNLYCQNIEGINVHKYGPHIFHTNDKAIWDYVNSFTPFNNFRYMPLASSESLLYNLPFNMHTFYQLWKVRTPDEAFHIIRQQVLQSGITRPANLEEMAISKVGTEIYQKLIKGYTEKQWGRKSTELPSSIFNRLCVRYTFDNNYFDDEYQGIPVGGYNMLIAALLSNIEVKTGVDFLKSRYELSLKGRKIVYTGSIDEFYDYKYGSLEYRSLSFRHSVLDNPNYQGVAVINYPDLDVPHTRIIEHKHFEFGQQAKTVITFETPEAWSRGMEAFYPINDEKNNLRYKQYSELSNSNDDIIFGGRLAEYKYYDMHQVIGSAIKKSGQAIKCLASEVE